MEKILTRTNEKDVPKLKEPEDYRVILLNDDYTTMEFVVEVLMLVFNKKLAEANEIMLDVHKKGRAVVGQRGDRVFRELKALLESFGIRMFHADDCGSYQRNIAPANTRQAKSAPRR